MGAGWVLDVYCGVGGATRGLQMAGHKVLGVDITAQPDYCGDDFYQGDAVEFIAEHGHKFTAICASPPCQEGCTLTAGTNRGRIYPQLTQGHPSGFGGRRPALGDREPASE